MTGIESIQGEIDSQRGPVPESQWLTQNGLISAPDAPYHYELVRDWHMPGAESYILDFKINSEAISKRLVAKACIKMCPADTVKEWHQRRQRIESAGIGVPRLYATHGADYIEEYVDMDLRTAHSVADTAGRNKLEDSFIETYKKLGGLGFKVQSLHDVRSRGQDIVLIDFGSDLGGYTGSPHASDRVLEEKAETELRRIVGKR